MFSLDARSFNVLCDNFSDSENFEKFCITRLDRMLEDAKELEIDLRRQKDVLREKLLNLSRTLQLD